MQVESLSRKETRSTNQKNMKTGKLFHIFLITLIINLISFTGIAQENINRIFDASSIKIAEVKELDVKIDNGKISQYRAKINLSFKDEKW